MIKIEQFLDTREQYVKVLLAILSLTLCVIIYLPGLQGDFLHDDIPNIIENDRLHLDTLDLNSILTASLSTDSGPLKRPISMFTFAINHYFTQLDPLSYKALNLFIHLMTGILLFFLTRLLLNSYEKIYDKELFKIDNFYIAFFIAAAWLASPINLTGVLYIVQRMTSLSALFSVAGLCFYVMARRSMIFKHKLNVYFFLLSGLFFVFSILSKENGALNIFYVLCIEICFFQFISNCSISTNAFKAIFITAIVAPVLMILIFFIKEPGYILNGYEHRPFSLTERVLTQARMMFIYLKWTIAPNITELGLYHDDIVTSKSLLDPITSLLSVIGIFIIFIVSILIKKRKPLLSFAVLFFLSSHLLESTIIPLELVYEHRNYLASYGIIFGIIASVFYTINSKSTLKFSVLICLLWFCAIASTTTLRSYQWQSDASFSYYEAEHHPKSARAVFSLAKVYANLTLLGLADEKEKTIKLLETSMQYMPHDIIGEASAILFTSLAKEKPEISWIEALTIKLNTFPLTHHSINSLSEINKCILSTCTLDEQQVYKFYEAALTNQTSYPAKVKSDLLTLYAKFSADKLGDLTVAYNAMNDAIELSPNRLQYRVNFITLLLIMKAYGQAELNIDYVESHDTFNLYEKEVESLKHDLAELRANTESS